MAYRRTPSNRKPRSDRLLSMDDIYRQPVGPASHPKSLYALLLRFVKWWRERNWSETTLKVQTHHSYRFICWAGERGVRSDAPGAGELAASSVPVPQGPRRAVKQPHSAYGAAAAAGVVPLDGKTGTILAKTAADLEPPFI